MTDINPKQFKGGFKGFLESPGAYLGAGHLIRHQQRDACSNKRFGRLGKSRAKWLCLGA